MAHHSNTNSHDERSFFDINEQDVSLNRTDFDATTDSHLDSSAIRNRHGGLWANFVSSGSHCQPAWFGSASLSCTQARQMMHGLGP